MSQEESTIQFEEFVKYQAWVLEYDPDLKDAINDQSELDDEAD